jgi:hypothetical protein
MAHSFIELRNTLPSPGAPTKIGIARRWQVASKPSATPLRRSCSAYTAPGQHGGQETILIHEHVLIERHVGHPDGLFVAQRAVIAEDRHFVNGILVMVEAAVAVVIADCVGCAEIGDPSGLEERDQPGLVLARHRHRAGH